MPLFYLRAFWIFFGLRAISVLTHYMGPSPWGGPLILSPDRFIPEALTIEAGLWLLVCGLGALIEKGVEKMPGGDLLLRPWRAGFLLGAIVFSIFSLIDFEVVRWLGQHMSTSYIRNFAGARDGQLFARILAGDLVYSVLAAMQMAAAVVAAIFLFVRYGKMSGVVPRRALIAFGVALVLGLSSPDWLRPSEKRWRRIRPASVGIFGEAVAAFSGQDRPKNPKRAHQDLIDLVRTGTLNQGLHPQNSKYPLFRDDNVGQLSAIEYQALPLDEKPDVILIVFETMRGMNTGFLGPSNGPLAAMPRLHAEIKNGARYFPRMHSAGYPSVAGAMGMHLGVWPHHSRIVFSSYLHIRTIGFPEMLRAAGYQTYALLGADPSFSNFTPWFRRWYGDMEYTKENHHDGPLVDRFIELYDQRLSSPHPQMMTLWTATTHPPYDVPAETGITPASDNEGRYLQAMRYADENIHRLLAHLKKSPRWDRTLVFLLGDHSQPVPWQWTHPETAGELNPGHTWTSFAIFGGSKFAPEAGRDERALSHVDLAPTVLAAINLRHGNHFFGRNVLADESERPVFAFRYGAISLEEGSTRHVFRIDSDAARAYGFDQNDVLSYGALENGTQTSQPMNPDLDRYRDAALAWAELLANDRVAPPDLN